MKFTSDLLKREIYLNTLKPLPDYVKREILKIKEEREEFGYYYTFPAYPNTCFVLQCMINKSSKLDADKQTEKLIQEQVNMANTPRIYLSSSKTHVGIEVPSAPYYMGLVKMIRATDKGAGFYTVPIARAHEALRIADSKHPFLPAPIIEPSIRKKVFAKLLPKGELYELFQAPIDELYTAKTAYQVPMENFRKAGYQFLSDLVFKRPNRYIDKTQVVKSLQGVEKDELVTIIGHLQNKRKFKDKHAVFTVDLFGKSIEVWFWNRVFFLDKFEIGEPVLIQGTLTTPTRISGNSCDSILESQAIPIVPIYPQSSKLKMTTRLLMNTAYEAIARLKAHNERLGDYIRSEMSFIEALEELHFPSSSKNYLKAIRTLAYFEMVALQLIIEDKKTTEVKERGLRKPYIAGGLIDIARNSLPFQLTEAQKKALVELNTYMSRESAETVLLSADVGSGKTLITQLACLQCVDNGFQAAMAAPTEVLAQQLYNTFVKLLKGIPREKRPTIVYLGGSTKAKEKRLILESISSGSVDLIVGTHSVLGNSVDYYNLGLVVIDEQQKFGKKQRENLKYKRRDGLAPDIIEQTATPIPQSTASAFYRHINFIPIYGKPAGRIPIQTEWIREAPKEIIYNKNKEIWKDLQDEIDKGHQVFCVLPIVYENPKLNVASVEETYKALQKLFPKIGISVVHGGQKKDEQAAQMQLFRENKTKIMVASVVIEVGVDIPNATRMVILNADRLGAAQLHQIRGRVGRSTLPSKCYLVSEGLTENSQVRLQSLVDFTDGFEIAKCDLKTRNHGDIFGTKQSGETSMRFANLVDHGELISSAIKEALRIYKSTDKNRALKDAYALIVSEEDDEE